jgi:uncharacterized protein YkwD
MLSREADYERAVAQSVRDRTNQARDRHGRDAITFVDDLDTTADDYAARMALLGELSHNLDDTTPQDRASAYSRVGENIHREQAPWTDCDHVSRQTVRAWLNSSSHRQNMMREQVSVGGVGVAQSGDWWYVCLLLSSGKKAHAKVADRVAGWVHE